ncbi:MAG: alpha-glycosidase, partial [Cohnella sp.]|nr:alpha-glycosidase [Cohnella sp.]
STMAYLRQADGERLVIALNAGKRKAALSLQLPDGNRPGEIGVVGGDGAAQLRGRKLHVSLPPVGFAIVQLG